MVVYHGTNVVIDKINIDKCKLRTDFGKGFYFTGKMGTAQEWAINRTDARGTGIPTVLSYNIDFEGLKKLHGIMFPDIPSIEWLNFIGMNRKKRPKSATAKEPQHDYHWVSGPIADDSMNDVVEEYLAGDMMADAAIRRAKILEHTYQLSIHTPEGLAYVDELNVLYRQRKGGRWLPRDPNWDMRK